MWFACIKNNLLQFQLILIFFFRVHSFMLPSTKTSEAPEYKRERDINCQARLFMSGIVRRVSLSLFRVPRTQPLGQPGSKHPFREVSAEAGVMKIPQCDMNLSDQ
jgi:hypothetical protein